MVLIEDERFFRRMLRIALGQLPQLRVVEEFEDGQLGLDYCLREKPEMLVVDLMLPGMHGLDVIKRMRAALPDTRVLVLTGHPDPTLPGKLLALGVHGLVGKTEPIEYVLQAVREVLRGGIFFAANVRPQLAADEAPTTVSALPALAVPLTPRELEVVQLVAEGLSSKEVASRLALSVRTVEKHRANSMKKVGVHDVTGLVRYCLQTGLAKL